MLKGHVDLQDIREIMFETDRYDTTLVCDLMSDIEFTVRKSSKMEDVMDTFELVAHGTSVVDDEGGIVDLSLGLGCLAPTGGGSRKLATIYPKNSLVNSKNSSGCSA